MLLTIYPQFVQASGQREDLALLRKILTVPNPLARYREDEPGTIGFLDDEGRFLLGLLYSVHEELVHHGIVPEYRITEGVDDPSNRELVECPPDILEGVTLRDYQTFSVEHAVHRRRGVVKVATGGGKTAIAAAVAKMVERLHEDATSLTFVNKTHLLHQTCARFKEYGLQDVGKIGAGILEPGRHTVAMVQTYHKLLYRQHPDLPREVTLINWDETHHLSARTWSAIGYSVPSIYSIGYSGTPFKEAQMSSKTPEDMQITGMTGRVIVDISASYLIDRGFLAQPHIFMIPIPKTHSVELMDDGGEPEESKSWHKVERAWITENEYRNQVITRLTAKLVSRGLNPLVLVSKIEHGKDLLQKFSEAGLSPVFLSGGPKRHLWVGDSVETVDIEDSDPEIEKYISGGYGVLLGSTVFDEGVDLPDVAAVVNCAGGKSFIKNFQRIGRGLRPKPGTNEAYIFDFLDQGHDWLMRHSSKRISDYRTEPKYKVYVGYRHTVDFFGEEW